MPQIVLAVFWKIWHTVACIVGDLCSFCSHWYTPCGVSYNLPLLWIWVGFLTMVVGMLLVEDRASSRVAHECIVSVPCSHLVRNNTISNSRLQLGAVRFSIVSVPAPCWGYLYFDLVEMKSVLCTVASLQSSVRCTHRGLLQFEQKRDIMWWLYTSLLVVKLVIGAVLLKIWGGTISLRAIIVHRTPATRAHS